MGGEVLAGCVLVFLGVLILWWFRGNHPSSLPRITILPILVLMLIVVGFTTILHGAGML
jgi:heme A synthase